MKTFFFIVVFCLSISIVSCQIQQPKTTLSEKPPQETPKKLNEIAIIPDKTDHIDVSTFSEKEFQLINLPTIQNNHKKEWTPLLKIQSLYPGPVMYHGIDQNNEKNTCVIYFSNPSATYDGGRSLPDYVDTLIAYDLTKQTVLWKCSIPKLTILNVIIDKDTIYIGTERGPTGNYEVTYAYALYKQNGKVKWRCKLDAGLTTNMILHKGKLFFAVCGSKGEFIICLDASMGSIIYSVPVPENVKFDYGIINYAFYSDPCLYIADAYDNIFSFHVDKKEYSISWKPGMARTSTDSIFLSFSGEKESHLFSQIISHSDKDSKIIVSSYNLKDLTIDRQIEFILDPALDNPVRPNTIIQDKDNLFLSYGNCLINVSLSLSKLNWAYRVDGYYVKEVIKDSGRLLVTIEPYEEYQRDYTKFKERYLLAIDAKTGEILWQTQKGVRIEEMYNDKLVVNDQYNLYIMNTQ